MDEHAFLVSRGPKSLTLTCRIFAKKNSQMMCSISSTESYIHRDCGMSTPANLGASVNHLGSFWLRNAQVDNSNE